MSRREQVLISTVERNVARLCGGREKQISDSEATPRVTYDVRRLTDNNEYSRAFRCAGGNSSPIVDTGSLPGCIRSGGKSSV